MKLLKLLLACAILCAQLHAAEMFVASMHSCIDKEALGEYLKDEFEQYNAYAQPSEKSAHLKNIIQALALGADQGNLLVKAIQMGDSRLIKSFIVTASIDELEDKNMKLPNYSPLMEAVCNVNLCGIGIRRSWLASYQYNEVLIPLIKRMKQCGVNLDLDAQRFDSARTALWYAAEWDNLPVVRLLIDNGADPLIEPSQWYKEREPDTVKRVHKLIDTVLAERQTIVEDTVLCISLPVLRIVGKYAGFIREKQD